jgi:hypothetical protein
LLDKIEAETGTEPDWQALAGELAAALSQTHLAPADVELLARYRAAIAQDGESPE